MPSNNVFQYNKIRTRNKVLRKALKPEKKMESSSFWNPESTVLESGIQYPESGIHSMESRIQDCPGFPYMGRYVNVPLNRFINAKYVFSSDADSYEDGDGQSF